MKTAIIGYGGMGAYHTQSIKWIPETIKITGIYDIDPDRLNQAKEDGFFAYASFEDVLKDESIELVIIATPNDTHKDLSIRLLQAGKNVICEKPVAMNSAELEDIIKVAQETGKVFTIHQNRRWDKDFSIVKRAVQEQIIGEAYFIESRVHGCRGVPHGWRVQKEAGGGMLLDWGVHMIDQLLGLYDCKVTEVYAHMMNAIIKEVDDNFKLLLRFENGVSALVEVCTNTFIPLPRWHVSGTGGTLILHDWDCQGYIKREGKPEYEWEQQIVYTSAGPTKTMAPRKKETIEEIPLPEADPDIYEYHRNVVAAVEHGEELLVTPQQALRVMNIIDAAFESSKTGACVKGMF